MVTSVKPDPVAAGRSAPGHNRAERLIVAGRVVLAAASLFALWLDPSSPSRHADIAYALLAGYLGYALLLVPLAWRVPSSMRRWGVATHSLDLGAFTLFVYFTEGPTSPFFVYFVFFLLAGAVRWQWRGALWTGLAATTIFVGMGLYMGYGVQDPAFALNRFIIRSVYLVLVTSFLGYLTAYEQALRYELAQIAAWPRTLPRELEALVRQQLAHTARLLGTSRVLMLWEDPEEPWVSIARLDDGVLTLEREPPSSDQPLVDQGLVDAHFYCADPLKRPSQAIMAAQTGHQRWRGQPLRPDLAVRFDMRRVLALRLMGDCLEGRLFALDVRGRAEDLLTLGGVLAHLVQSDLERFLLQGRLLEAAAAEERVRLARDLHDGLLQSMTATGLQLEAALRLLEQDPVATRKRLRDLQALIGAEQADLRTFVEQLRELPQARTVAVTAADARLDELAQRIAGQWGMQVELTRDHLYCPIDEGLGGEIYRIVQECLANAARHGGATRVRVGIGSRDGGIRIEVADNGRGFPFRGRYDLAALSAAGIGPWSLRQRVAALGGALVVESGEQGARLEIEIPAQAGPTGRETAGPAPTPTQGST